jgi:hypothetical protein
MLLCPVYVTAERPGDYVQLYVKTATIPGLLGQWYFEMPGLLSPRSEPKK